MASPLLLASGGMYSRDSQGVIEAYLVIEQPRQRHSHWSAVLSRLDDRRAPQLAGVTGFYDAATDQALIGLRYDEAKVGRDGLASVVQLALLEEIGMIQPAELTQGDRHRFLTERLARCALHVTGLATCVETLGALVRQIRQRRTSASAVAEAIGWSGTKQPLPPPPKRPSPLGAIARPATATPHPRGDTIDPVLLVRSAGTRDDLAGAAAATRVERSPGRAGTIGVRPASGVESDVHRASTREMPTVDVFRQAAETARVAGTRAQTGPPAPRPGAMIYARYLRSGRWIPSRIGALSIKGAALLTGALPRLDDRVDVALSFGQHRALVRGSVGKVSSREEAAATGTATFSVKFELDDASRRQLTELLTAARAANITIKPPPARTARRFSVEWPMGIGTARGVVRAEALDVSRCGMFVRPLHPLDPDEVVTFSAVLDDGHPVHGRARCVRHITDEGARATAMLAGYGLHIVEMTGSDRQRWEAFVRRIEKRSECRVLVGAAPGRVAALQAALAAAGYAVTVGTDPGVIVQLAGGDVRPVDAALLDAGWLTAGSTTAEQPSWLESLFATRKVPCLTLDGDVRRARMAVDRLLLGTDDRS